MKTLKTKLEFLWIFPDHFHPLLLFTLDIETSGNVPTEGFLVLIYLKKELTEYE